MNNSSYKPMSRPAAHYPIKSQIPWPDENNHQYKCCCDHCHVRRGTMIVGVVELVWAGLHFVYALQNTARGVSVAPSSAELTLSSIFLLVVLLMLYGVYKETKWMLILHLAWSIIFIILALILGCLVVVAWIVSGAAASILIANSSQIEDRIWKGQGVDYEDTYPSQNETSTQYEGEEIMDYYFEPKTEKSLAAKNFLLVIVIGILVAFILTIVFEIWFFVIILACYRYLRDKERYFQSDLEAEGIPLKNMIA